MSNTLEVLRKRRSIRKYSPEPLSAQQLKQLQEIALRSPSSRALMPWQFIFVRDKEKLCALGQSKPHGAAFLEQCALAVVLCADPQRSDVWIEDCSVVATLLHLAAADMGLGSCWVQIRKRQHDDSTAAEAYVRSILNIPEQMRVGMIIGIGHPAEEKAGHPHAELPAAHIHLNNFTPK